MSRKLILAFVLMGVIIASSMIAIGFEKNNIFSCFIKSIAKAAEVKNSGDKNNASSNTMHNVLEAMQVRKSYVNPILENIWSKPISCEKLSDVEKYFNKIKDFYERDESIHLFIDDEIDYKDENMHYEEYLLIINAETEHKIQKNVEGHICLAFPNKPTISELADIWEEAPCSKASPLALYQIVYILGTGKESHIFVKGEYIMTFKDEWIKMTDYIIDNYPNTWEAKKIIGWRKLKESGQYSIENMHAWEEWIEFVENNNILDNKYYKLWCSHYGINNIERNFTWTHYSALSSIYLTRCEEDIEKQIKEKGRTIVTSEAIEMYNKHRKLRNRRRKNHPKYHKEMSTLPRCYKMIKKHAPEHYKGDPPLRKE